MTAVLEELLPGPAITTADPLLAALHRLDHVLEAAIARAREGAADAGSIADIRARLGREPGAPLLYASPALDGSAAVLDGAVRLDWLAHAFGLEPFDLDLVVLALAPEVELRYERLFGYLQDDATVRRPTVGLALDLLCSTMAERLARRAHFTTSGALVHHRLLRVPIDGAAAGASLLAQPFALDPQIANLLLCSDALDSRLARVCRLTAAGGPVAGGSAVGSPAVGGPAAADSVYGDVPVAVLGAGVPAQLYRAATTGESCVVYFSGPPGSGKYRASLAAAAKAGLSHLTIDIGAMLAGDDDIVGLLTLALRDAWFRNAVAYLRGGDLLWRDERARRRVPLAALFDEHAGPVILGGTQPWVAGTAELSGVLAIGIPVPDRGARRRLWASSLARENLLVPSEAADTLATRFRLTADQIADAAATAARRLYAAAPDAAAIEAELFASARAGRGHELAALATRVPARHRWDSLVLPDESVAQLREICQRVMRSEMVLETWGFRERLSRGCGVTVLFSGASGTGKTMAAEVIAGELGLDVYRVELAGVVSKYIGETEKNLDRIFEAAEHSNAILLFDEADALFGKRSEVRDAHDRYANIEVSYLLQRMESYEGIAILATNLRGNLDAAFVRRLAFTVVFPFPDAESRRRIWERIWPNALPRAADIDCAALAERFPLSGGNIRNIALGAAFLAAEAGTDVTLAHVLHATNREYQKLGKTLTPDELQ